jgi:hypothetical protein
MEGIRGSRRAALMRAPLASTQRGSRDRRERAFIAFSRDRVRY